MDSLVTIGDTRTGSHLPKPWTAVADEPDPDGPIDAAAPDSVPLASAEVLEDFDVDLVLRAPGPALHRNQVSD